MGSDAAEAQIDDLSDAEIDVLLGIYSLSSERIVALLTQAVRQSRGARVLFGLKQAGDDAHLPLMNPDRAGRAIAWDVFAETPCAGFHKLTTVVRGNDAATLIARTPESIADLVD